MPKGLPFVLTDYLELIDWTGQIGRQYKRGNIAAEVPPLLQRLRIDGDAWIKLGSQFETAFRSFAGREDSMQKACEALGRKWLSGTRVSRALLPTWQGQGIPADGYACQSEITRQFGPQLSRTG